MAKDFLSVEDQAKVTDAAEKDLAVAVEETPSPEGGPAPTPDAADTAGTTQAAQGGDEVKAAAATAEPVVGQKVPYDRFNEVVVQKNEALQRVKEYEERLVREVELGASSRARAILENIAKRRPELAAEIYGPESEQAKAVSAAEKLPEDPVQRELAVLKREAGEQRSWREKQEQQSMVADMEDRAEAAMEKFPILTKNDKIQALAETVIVQKILARPQVPVEKVVEEVAAEFRHFEESIKAEYKQAKIEPTKKIPAGVGAGSAAPPGAARKKFSLDRPGELARALASSLQEGE